MSSNTTGQTGQALEKTYQFLLWLIPVLDGFPQRQKYLLGDRIERTALDVLEGVIEATYTRNRNACLSAINIKLNKLRILFRLATELRLIDRRRYEHASRLIDEIGRLIGGWMKASHGQAIS
ncbi:Diversity-generating retroelement protein Avd [Azospirillaceae bacterium]